ncbi:hypothetical protein OsJ_07421 [Oryza sativa Japonica Group]|uniref:Uncharacterized protein n=1 Tax=Oryza sativa subsp. japonica TaxID=39947 RepID=B9F0Y1_ORYSJ|nr:hypothetical protein OsJ_07421 [Oryza sativa Japonica Group]
MDTGNNFFPPVLEVVLCVIIKEDGHMVCRDLEFINSIVEIGIGLVGFGILFSFFGVILFFDRGLLALGNIFFLTGIGLLLGWQSMWQLFTKKANIKGSVPFFLGLFLLFVRWPVAGIIMELYGSFVLFSGYGPPIQAFLYQIPVIGWILQYPFQVKFLFL